MQDLNSTKNLYSTDGSKILKNHFIGDCQEPSNYFFNCHFSNVVFTNVNSSGVTEFPTFNKCYFDNCDFTQLPLETVIVFKQDCYFTNCKFASGQKIQIAVSTNFINCENVNVTFAATGEYTIRADGSSISFPDYTSESYETDYKVNLSMVGGKLTLPNFTNNLTTTISASWVILAVGTEIIAEANTFSAEGLLITGCHVKAKEFFRARNIVGCLIKFDGTDTNTTARLSGTLIAANEVGGSKANVEFEAPSLGAITGGVVVANRVTMTPGNCTFVNTPAAGFNYNGLVVSPAPDPGTEEETPVEPTESVIPVGQSYSLKF